ncbi:TetR/AcrR family transcriptional regulator [Streptomyces sp. TRM75563]|uniref:TetR/AcrR family transcriptional regulator n=1 Tax=Streptomyces sp. TRM75563 TaxID=2817418 RepID=UPI001F611C2B|nr:TetR/AcrR family transcriptional regulator [Streptomyces sp. TRM75563]MCI4041422.1 TetR/AcrR family transcriptional regulator [Streptomyces sp. TRM75563]
MTDGRQTRNAERTRRAVLDAAVQVILDKGAAVTLAQVAAAAGVSKSGLIHHFGSRDQLVVALVEDTHERFRETVRSHLDLSENYPGKMLRAYVRALCAGSAEAATARDFTSAPMWGGLYTIPAVVPVMEENSAWWDEQLALDGISPERILIVRRAAEGIAMAAVYGEQDESSISTARDLLLELASEGTFRTPL